VPQNYIDSFLWKSTYFSLEKCGDITN